MLMETDITKRQADELLNKLESNDKKIDYEKIEEVKERHIRVDKDGKVFLINPLDKEKVCFIIRDLYHRNTELKTIRFYNSWVRLIMEKSKKYYDILPIESKVVYDSLYFLDNDLDSLINYYHFPIVMNCIAEKETVLKGGTGDSPNIITIPYREKVIDKDSYEEVNMKVELYIDMVVDAVAPTIMRIHAEEGSAEGLQELIEFHERNESEDSLMLLTEGFANYTSKSIENILK